ncbi:MAG: hypothetical protein IJT25_02515 [Clostridia bacterium]|nr:hypothetical protein [Clostridia bacterium]
MKDNFYAKIRLGAIEKDIKERQKKRQTELCWDVYEDIMPTKLLAETNVKDYFSQDAIDNLACKGLLCEFFDKTYNNYSVKACTIKNNHNLTFTKKLGDRKYVFLLSNKAPGTFENVELIYVEDDVVKDKLFINNSGVRYVTTGKKFPFKEIQEEKNANDNQQLDELEK